MTPKPLDGVRIIDLCVVWAGPFGSMLLADLGAEVIKPENPFVWQTMTRGPVARPTKLAITHQAPWMWGYPGNDGGDAAWNYCPAFVSVFRNKKSFTVDLRRPEGLEILRRLVAVSDVVYENNATGTLEKLGITYDWLRETNPRIVLVRVPAFGNWGPYADARAFGVNLEAVMGHTLLRGYHDTDASSNTSIYSGDYFGGAMGAFAVMTALWERDRTGEGQLVEVAQAENAAPMFTQAIMDYSLNGRMQAAAGNRDVHGRAPSGVYPAKSPGGVETQDDHWIAISIESDGEWEAFVAAIGNPEWACDRRFATNDGRAAAHAELDRLIGDYTSGYEDYELMHRLQAAGVAAAPVLEASRLLQDPHLRSREFFQPMTIPGAGTHDYSGALWKFPRTPVEFRPPVTFGEHNEYVYRELLGVSEQEYEALRGAGQIATAFDPSIP